MQNVIKITPDNKEQWLALRGQSIGGSELATMLGLNKWQSPYKLWEQKTGRAEPFVDNNATLRGKYIESGVANWWADETGNTLIKASEGNIVYQHTKHKVSGSPDYRYFPKDETRLSKRKILEIKTMKTNIPPEDLPMSFFLQPNLYAALLGYEGFTIAWFSMFDDQLQYVDYDIDMELYNMCCEEADIFWEKYVLADTPPPIRTEEDVLRLFPEEKKGKILIADNNLEELYSEAVEPWRKIKGLNSSYNTVTDKVKLIMEDAEQIVDMNMNKLFTWKANKFGSRIFKIYEI